MKRGHKVILENMTSGFTFKKKTGWQHSDFKDWIAPDVHVKSKIPSKTHLYMSEIS